MKKLKVYLKSNKFDPKKMKLVNLKPEKSEGLSLKFQSFGFERVSMDKNTSRSFFKLSLHVTNLNYAIAKVV